MNATSKAFYGTTLGELVTCRVMAVNTDMNERRYDLKVTGKGSVAFPRGYTLVAMSSTHVFHRERVVRYGKGGWFVLSGCETDAECQRKVNHSGPCEQLAAS